MAINPAAPKLPEVDIALLQSGEPWIGPTGPNYTDPNFGIPNDQAQPEVDITLLPGVPGQRGPTGPGVTDEQIAVLIPSLVSYKHNQISASSSWTITHNLKFFPNVTAFDSGGTMVEGNVVHQSNLSLTIGFSAAISGNAVLS